MRTTKTLANGQETEYYYSGSTLMYEHREITYNGAADGLSIYYTYDGSGNLSSIRRIIDSTGSSAIYYAVCNSRGDVEAFYDTDGTLVVKYTYDAWGNIVSVKNGNGVVITNTMNIGLINPFRYRGYYYDSETGLYYLQSRYYDPSNGRFLNADGIMGANADMSTYNLFAYCGNNPVNCFDSTGYSYFPNIVGILEANMNMLECVVEEYCEYSYMDYIGDIVGAAYDSFEVELGFGGGLGVGVAVGNFGFDAYLLRFDLLNLLITKDNIYLRQLLQMGLSLDLILLEVGPQAVLMWDAMSGETIVDEGNWYRNGSITLCSASAYFLFGGTFSIKWNYDKYSQYATEAGNKLQ